MKWRTPTEMSKRRDEEEEEGDEGRKDEEWQTVQNECQMKLC